jgi:hypothetical protein
MKGEGGGGGDGGCGFWEIERAIWIPPTMGVAICFFWSGIPCSRTTSAHTVRRTQDRDGHRFGHVSEFEEDHHCARRRIRMGFAGAMLLRVL